MAGEVIEIKVSINAIEDLKISTGLKNTKDIEGETVQRMVTHIAFDCEIPPEKINDMNILMWKQIPVTVVLGSPQGVLNLAK